jgi:hypothetical protein
MAVSTKIKEAVRERAGNLCEYCHRSDWLMVPDHTLDHIIPQSKGGSDTIENLALACPDCNVRKLDHTEAKVDGKLVPVFNPRADDWNDHFEWSVDKLEIVPLTDIGVGTLELLDLNGKRNAGRENKLRRIRKNQLANSLHPPTSDRVRQE